MANRIILLALVKVFILKIQFYKIMPVTLWLFFKLISNVKNAVSCIGSGPL